MNQAGTARKSTALLLAALVGVLMMFSGSASAHNRHFSTPVTLSYDGTNFTGYVSSQNSACVPGRTVTLFERQPGGGATAVGSTTTDGSGNFTIPQPGADGLYFVTVSAGNLGGGYGHSHVCNGAESRTVPAGSGVLGGSQGNGNGNGGGGVAGAGGTLPFTGAEIAGFVVVAFLLIALGTVLVRRRNSSEHAPGS
nr:hypothetical protein [Actinomycetota bacterium]